MVTQLLKGLAEEKVILINSSQAAKLPFALKGIVRLVDKKGNTLGVVLDKGALEDIEEGLEASSPKFWASLEKSRKSGRVSGQEIERRLGIK